MASHNLDALQQAVDDWNKRHPPGTAVKITNNAGIDTLTTTKSVAMIYAKSEAVVYTHCKPGFFNINKLAVIE